MESDAIIDVRFKTPEENGRQTAVTGDYYSCPFIVGGTAVAQLLSKTGYQGMLPSPGRGHCYEACT